MDGFQQINILEVRFFPEQAAQFVRATEGMDEEMKAWKSLGIDFSGGLEGAILSAPANWEVPGFGMTIGTLVKSLAK